MENKYITNRFSIRNKNVVSDCDNLSDPHPNKNPISGADVLNETRDNVCMKCNLLEFNEVCSLLKIGRSTLYSLINSKAIKAVKLLGRTLFRESDIYEFVATLPEYEGGPNGF